MTTRKPSYGDGRYMTVEEAVERRRRIIARWGSLRAAQRRRGNRRNQERRRRTRLWAGSVCWGVGCYRDADAPEDVIVVQRVDGTASQPHAMCRYCRGVA